MSYTDVEWTNGDTPTAVKGNTMQGNLDYVREVQRGRTVLQTAGAVTASTIFGTYSWELRITVGSYTWDSATISSSTFVAVTGLRNKDISALATNVPYRLTAAFVSGSEVREILAGTFVRHESDENFLSVFAEATRSEVGVVNPTLRGLTAIATRDNEGF